MSLFLISHLSAGYRLETIMLLFPKTIEPVQNVMVTLEIIHINLVLKNIWFVTIHKNKHIHNSKSSDHKLSRKKSIK